MVESLLSPGVHLTSPRLGYRHHGLYAGNGRVLHYGGLHRWGRRGKVEEVSLAHFARGRGWAVQASAVHLPFAPEQAVERARSRLGEDSYRLWTNNCEHFVAWCLSGQARSTQVEAVQSRLAGLRAAVLGIVGRGRRPAAACA